MKNFIQLIVVTWLCGALANAGDLTEHKVTLEQARTLIIEALTPQQRHLPKIEVEQYASPSPSRFLFFTVTWAGTTNGSVVVGNYAVDPFTGDVWSAVTSCEEETNRGLRLLQARLRSALHLSQSQYRQLKTKGPLCDFP
jgi:hypothetical protein